MFHFLHEYTGRNVERVQYITSPEEEPDIKH